MTRIRVQVVPVIKVSLTYVWFERRKANTVSNSDTNRMHFCSSALEIEKNNVSHIRQKRKENKTRTEISYRFFYRKLINNV